MQASHRMTSCSLHGTDGEFNSDPTVVIMGRNNSTGNLPDKVTLSAKRKKSVSARRFSVVQSTEQHFESTDDLEFYGAYAHIRRTLDYSFHVHYTKSRQWLHDSIIEDHLHDSSAPDGDPDSPLPCAPWLILTAGVQGAGKRYTVSELVKTGRLPLLSLVRVDTDQIRRCLPEYQSYIEDAPDLVESLTQKECGYIAETLTLAALESRRNVVLDSSLQDVDWYKTFLRHLRAKIPTIKIGLIYVVSELDTILSRVKHRTKETGRSICEEETTSIYSFVEESVNLLEHDVDYSCKISNDGDNLQIFAEGGWEQFYSVFQQSDFGEEPKLVRFTSENFRKNGFASGGRQLRRRFSVVKSSEENHMSDDRNFYGPFAYIREALDYSYHKNYTFERQRFQDAIVNEFLESTFITDRNGELCTTPTEPWIVFTAGPMGAGKSYTMKKLVKRGLFPLLAFVRVDPDEIRRYMPEFHLYVQQNPELAGELTRREAGFISEILTLAGLHTGKNVLVDGSLRDANWYEKYFDRLRKEFPILRIAIIHVSAPRDTVFQRAAERGMKTGRIVPRETLVAALDQVPKSVRMLAPLVDYHVELRNATDIEIVDPPGETWESFSKNWIQTCAWVPAKERMLKVSSKTSFKSFTESAMNGKSSFDSYITDAKSSATSEDD